MILCASPSYLERQGKPKTVDELKQHEAIGYTRFGSILNWKLCVDGVVEEFSPKARVMMDDLKGVLDATISNLGVGWIPSWLAFEYLESGELIEIMTDFTSVDFPISAIWPRTLSLPLKTRVAVDSLLEKLPARLLKVEPKMK